MRLAVEIVWWIGIIGALPATLVIVKEALLVIGTLRKILALAGHTEVAARGIVVHVAPAGELHGAGELVRRLDDAVGDVTQRLGALPAWLERRVGAAVLGGGTR